MTTRMIYVIYQEENGKITFTETEGVGEPALEVVYDNGNKYLFVIPRAYITDFRGNRVEFIVEQYLYSSDFESWALINTGKFNNSQLALKDDYLVDSVSGEAAEEMTEEEKETATLIGEYAFWFFAMGKTMVFPPLLNSLKKKLGVQ